MSGLNEFFQDPTAFRHPKIRAWLNLIEGKKGEITCEIDRKREGLGFRRARIYIHWDAGPAVATDQDDWDRDLNQFLIHHGIRAVSPENEGVRFGLMLKEFLKKPEVRFGDGYFNAVLLELVTEAFKDNANINPRLKEIGPANPSHGRSYAECVEMIKASIAFCATSLVKQLKYEQPLAEQILAGGMGHYLDERFSLVSRKLFGLR